MNCLRQMNYAIGIGFRLLTACVSMEESRLYFSEQQERMGL